MRQRRKKCYEQKNSTYKPRPQKSVRTGSRPSDTALDHLRIGDIPEKKTAGTVKSRRKNKHQNDKRIWKRIRLKLRNAVEYLNCRNIIEAKH